MEALARTLSRSLVACVALVMMVASLASASRAQASIKVNARLNSGVVKLGSNVTLSIEVDGTFDATLAPLPAVDKVRLTPMGAPDRQQRWMSIGNGTQTVSRSLTFTIAVQPLEKGEYTIPPITVHAEGKDYTTREATLKAVEDIQGEEFGVFELDAPREVVEGQPFTIEMRFGWESVVERGLNFANLSLPWLGELSGLLELDAPLFAQSTPAVELSLNSRNRVRAERMPERKVGDRTFTILRVQKRFVATRTGKLSFPTSHLEFGRVPEQSIFAVRTEAPTTYFKRFPAFDIEVTKLPEEGRPIDFSGLVGSVKTSMTADRRLVDAGDSIKLSVEWTGEGNLEFFQPPDLARLDAFKDFRIYGMDDHHKTFERRTVIYDIAPTKPEITEIPSVPLSIYDSASKTYTTIRTQPIPIQVRALKNASPLALEGTGQGFVVDIRDIQTGPLIVAQPLRPQGRTVVGLGALIAVGWLALRTLVRKSGDPDAPRARARRAAKKQLVRALAGAKTASAQSHALSGFLAARTGESLEAWSGRDVIEWARKTREAEDAANIADEDARSLAQMFARLDERTWAGRDEAVDAAPMLALADKIAKGGL